jgi:hypothetical protein
MIALLVVRVDVVSRCVSTNPFTVVIVKLQNLVKTSTMPKGATGTAQGAEVEDQTVAESCQDKPDAGKKDDAAAL